MFVVTVNEARNRLAALIERVRAGDSVLIVDRGLPVARLESAAGTDPDGRIARLERAGIVRASRRSPTRGVLATRPPRTKQGAGLVRALLEERGDGR